MSIRDRLTSERTGPPATTPEEQSFARRVVIAVGITLLFTAAGLFLWYSVHVLLLAFAAVLVAVLLRASADWVAQRLHIGPGSGLIAVLLTLVGFVAVLGVFIAPTVVRQVETLSTRLPESLRTSEEKLRSHSWGRLLLGESDARGANESGPENPPQAAKSPTDPATLAATQPTTQPSTESSTQPTLIDRVVDGGDGGKGVAQHATWMLSGFLGGLLTLCVVLASGIYLASSPEMYVEGLVMLAPHARRTRYREVLSRLGQVLVSWMIAQLVPMAVIGALTAIGLKLIGVELWFILGLLAALFNFIPNFGPLISGIPAFLLALAQGPTQAMWVVVLYVVAQGLEGYVLTPLVQRRAVDMPPALMILFQVLAGLLLGALGVVLAAPLLAVVVVAVKMLYVEDVLGDKANVPGDEGDDTPDRAGVAAG